MNSILGLIVSVAYIAIILLSAKMFEKAGKEASRKYVHIMLSNWWIIAIIFFKNPIVAAILPFCFVILNYASYRMNLFEVIERNDGDENKDSLGTVYYAVSLFILAILTFGPANNPLIGLCGIATMGYGDGLAAVIGQAVKSKKYEVFGNTKSVAGSLTMFFVTLLIVSGFLIYSQSAFVALKSIIVAVIMTIVEASSIKGTDNLSVPLLTSLLVFFMV